MEMGVYKSTILLRAGCVVSAVAFSASVCSLSVLYPHSIRLFTIRSPYQFPISLFFVLVFFTWATIRGLTFAVLNFLINSLGFS